MASRLWSRPAALGVALSLVSVSAVCAASEPPPVPPVSEIPIAPLPRAKRAPAPSPTPPSTTQTTTTVTTTTTVPSLAAVTVEPSPNGAGGAGRVGATEAMPPLPPSAATPPAAAPHVILVDEEPFRASHTRARELPEHAEHASRHGKKHGRHGRPYHPAPGIVVDVPEASGGAAAADLQRLARSVGYWPFRHCYEEGLRRDQHLSGHVNMDLAVAPGGGVDRASLTGASLHDESTVLCVVREASHLALAPGQTATTAKLDVTLSTGDEPVPTPHAMPHADDLREALRSSWPAVRQCYAGGLARHADDGGRMELKFHVRAHGDVDEVSEGETRFGDVDVTRCVLGVYRSAKLPAGHGGHEATFVYAMHFESRPPPPPAQ